MTKGQGIKPSHKQKAVKGKRKALFILLYIFIVLMILLILAEIFVRMRGIKPWHPEEIAIRVEPGNKFFRTDPVLGFTHLPGKFNVMLADGYTWTTTHQQDTRRITQPEGASDSLHTGGEIWIFGCSFTHGWSLNDNETYPWLLQEMYPQYKIVNYGTSGYGTIHFLYQLKEALKKGIKPKNIIVTYAAFHDERNTFLRSRRKDVAPWNKLGPVIQPYARIDKEGKLQYSFAKVEYREFPLMRQSGLIHLAEMLYNRNESKNSHSHDVSKALMLEMADLAAKNKINFAVAGIWDDDITREMLVFCLKKGIKAVDISVDLTQVSNTNLPHDNHPGPAACRQYADKLSRFMNTYMFDKN